MNISDYKYKIELHAHTLPASPCAAVKPEDTVKRYADLGFDAIVITNHFCKHSFRVDEYESAKNAVLADYYAAKNMGEKCGLNVILGMEMRFPENANDYLLYGIDENDIKALYDFTNTDFVTFYKGFKNERNLILQAHPFRKGMVLADPEYLDGIETFNMHPSHNSCIALATRYAKEHPHFITTCGTDFHYDTHQGLGGILAKVLPTDSFELVNLLKSRDYLFNVAGSIVIP
jgi:predicted metal-dependent phosphoesterase TrpH